MTIKTTTKIGKNQKYKKKCEKNVSKPFKP